MENKVKEIQDFLHEKGMDVPETAIVNAAIDIARRWGGNSVFVSEFLQREKR